MAEKCMHNSVHTTLSVIYCDKQTKWLKLLGKTLYFSHKPTPSLSLNTRQKWHLNYLIWINAKFNFMQTQKERGKKSLGINPMIYAWEHKAITSSNWFYCNDRSGPPRKIWQLFIGATVTEGLGTGWYFYTWIMTTRKVDSGTSIPNSTFYQKRWSRSVCRAPLTLLWGSPLPSTMEDDNYSHSAEKNRK